MRQRIIAGNWKMNMTWAEAQSFAREIAEASGRLPGDVTLLLAPPFPYILALSEILGHRIKLGAQNCSAYASGAHTGEVSAAILASCGVEFCIVGHSERRIGQGETNAIVVSKARQLLSCGIRPIYCCGETREERSAGQAKETVRRQLEGLAAIPRGEFSSVAVAYEPVWAIGTGVTADNEQAQEMHAFIREELDGMNPGQGASMSLIYGGSCHPGNAAGLFAQPDIDGGLIGGASLKAKDLMAIALAYGN